MTRSGSRECQRAEWEALRSSYGRVLLDLGCGDGSHVRRFATEHPDWLVVGLDTDRDALRGAAQRCARRPERGGAPNTLFIAADAVQPPPELDGVAARLTAHFPWAALLRLILEDAESFVGLLSQLAADPCEVELVLNAAAAPEGLERPTPESVGEARCACRSPRRGSRFAPAIGWTRRMRHGRAGRGGWSRAAGARWSGCAPRAQADGLRPTWSATAPPARRR